MHQKKECKNRTKRNTHHHHNQKAIKKDNGKEKEKKQKSETHLSQIDRGYTTELIGG